MISIKDYPLTTMFYSGSDAAYAYLIEFLNGRVSQDPDTGGKKRYGITDIFYQPKKQPTTELAKEYIAVWPRSNGKKEAMSNKSGITKMHIGTVDNGNSMQQFFTNAWNVLGDPDKIYSITLSCNPYEIKEIFYQPKKQPTTVVKFYDGSTQVVTLKKGDTADIHVAIMYAIMKHNNPHFNRDMKDLEDMVVVQDVSRK